MSLRGLIVANARSQAELNAPEKALRCLDKSKYGFFGSWGISNKSEDGLPSCISMEAAEFALVSSIYTLGGFLGALSAGPLSSRKGRKLALRLTSPFFLVGSILEAATPNIPTLALGRFLSGVGAGISIVVGPVYVSEISPPSLRGTLGASTQIMTNVGILITQVLGYFFSYESMWRGVLGSGAIVAVLHFLGLLALVESHEWLGANGHESEAMKVLDRIRSGKLSPEEALRWGRAGPVDEQESLLAPTSPTTATAGRKKKESVGILAIFRHPDHWMAVIAVIAVMLAQQLCGINSVMMYSVSFLSELLPTAAGLITVAVGVLNLVVTAACSPLPDRIGRKTCLLMSIAGMGVNSLLLAFGIMYNVQVLSAVATLLFVASFALGLGPVPFILASELVGPEAVGATQSIALGANWSATFVVAQFFPMLNAAMGKGRVFFIFAALALVAFLFISWWVPESKDKANADEVWGRERRED